MSNVAWSTTTKKCQRMFEVFRAPEKTFYVDSLSHSFCTLDKSKTNTILPLPTKPMHTELLRDRTHIKYNLTYLSEFAYDPSQEKEITFKNKGDARDSLMHLN